METATKGGSPSINLEGEVYLVKFDWIKFLESNSIEYVEHGPNVKKGNVNIHCPFCGPSDPSHHLGIDPVSKYWGCWRDRRHRGKSPVRLVMRLIRCTLQRAKEICGYDSDTFDPEEFNSLNHDDLFGDGHQIDKGELVLDKEFRKVRKYGLERRFASYLNEERNFRWGDVDELVTNYQLHCALTGDFKGRIIFPVSEGGKLVTWTARACGNATVRYRALERKRSLMVPADCLYNHDAASKGGRILFVVEGPLDVLKMDFYGKGLECRAVGLSTKNLSERQKYLLFEMINRYDLVVFMLDKGEEVDSEGMAAELSINKRIPVTALPPPFDRKDPGELLPAEVKKFCSYLITNLEKNNVNFLEGGEYPHYFYHDGSVRTSVRGAN